MSVLIPNRFLFDFEFVLAYRPELPVIDGDVASWTDEELLPRFGELDGREDFAEVWACWNETGICIACRVTGKRKPLRCNPRKFWAGDNLRLCTDMRDARTVKRATRFCQQFFFLPTGGGPRRTDPTAGVNIIKRAREDAPLIPAERIAVASRVKKDGYTMEAFIPDACLSGFDPGEHPRIGFYHILEDAEFGQQYLTVGDELYWYVDPSTWATAKLVKPGDGKDERVSRDRAG